MNKFVLISLIFFSIALICKKNFLYDPSYTLILAYLIHKSKLKNQNIDAFRAKLKSIKLESSTVTPDLFDYPDSQPKSEKYLGGRLAGSTHA